MLSSYCQVQISFSRPQHSWKLPLRTWFLCLGRCFFFEFWLVDKHLFHITSLHTSSYVLMRLEFLEVSNRVSNWNKKNDIYVGWIIQIFQLDIPIFIYKFISLISLKIWISHGFFVFNRVASWIKGTALILVLSSFQIYHHVILVSHSN